MPQPKKSVSLSNKGRINDYQSGALWKYAQTVGSPRYGAVTHGGAKLEKISYDKL
jgi:dihydroxy-acid dehydratase